MKILFISLGCDKNLVDSEVMLGLLTRGGFELTNETGEADIAVINTCSFIHDAKQESVNTILEMAEYKKQGSLKVLIVTGCLAERYKDEIMEEIDEVDAVLGTTSYDDIVSVVDRVLQGEDKIQCFKDIDLLPESRTGRVVTTGGYFSYLKIAEGCDKRCSYCIIPKLRGRYRSVPMEDVVADAKALAAQGVKELNIVAQEITVYGKDLYGEKSLHILLKKLCEIPEIRWIRLLYCYPEEIYDELIETIKSEPKICHYMDMPIQHASDRILKKMGRRTNRDELVAIIEKLRREIPDITLRTTLITGFPGETKEDHQILKNFIREMAFDRLGVFTYSAEEDTAAALMEGQIDEEVKEARKDELMQIQQEIAFATAENMVGRTVEVLIEGKIPEDGIYIGRTYKDAPDVDGYIFVNAEEEMMSGDMVQVEVTGASDYDLIGDVIYEFTE
ncbi:MAG: 30S ribosomal protein S12 methylthiotransferase RimO [Clostridiales bacterium]|nr:30S ribosomal protein S12 methylthiotransferase RimO [Clostridiales bacterium]MDY3747467.1 30S ribosomal protein S12 methylthiotransferase RimO [Lachnospiraceae bacterium]